MHESSTGQVPALSAFVPQPAPERSWYDIAIVGGGIVGLATARELLLRRPGLRLIVVEKELALATQQSGHNSGVLHTGIYYPPGSLKARACVEGHRRMITFCEENDIPLKLCGKLIVAVEESELVRLEELYRRGIANGVKGLELVGPERLRELEPFAAGIKGIFSPHTGIVDYGLVAHAYARFVQQRGGEIMVGQEVTSILQRHASAILTTRHLARGTGAPACSLIRSERRAAAHVTCASCLFVAITTCCVRRRGMWCGR